MRILLDTNAFVRWGGDRPVPKAVSRTLKKQNTEIHVSIVSVWEVAIKHSLHASVADVQTSIASMSATLVPITFEHLKAFSDLPAFVDHRDPFDRLLIAQAISENLTIVSADTRFEKYKRLRVLWD